MCLGPTSRRLNCFNGCYCRVSRLSPMRLGFSKPNLKVASETLVWSQGTLKKLMKIVRGKKKIIFAICLSLYLLLSQGLFVNKKLETFNLRSYRFSCISPSIYIQEQIFLWSIITCTLNWLKTHELPLVSKWMMCASYDGLFHFLIRKRCLST